METKSQTFWYEFFKEQQPVISGWLCFEATLAADFFPL